MTQDTSHGATTSAEPSTASPGHDDPNPVFTATAGEHRLEQSAAGQSPELHTVKKVVGTAKNEVKSVAHEATAQARDLIGEAQTQLRTQSTQQRDNAVTGLRSLSDELDRMASSTQSDDSAGTGTGTELVRQVSKRTRDFAGFLEQRDPGQLLDEVRSFARERPGMFLGIAAAAGVVAGRLTRVAVTEAAESHDHGTDHAQDASGPNGALTADGSFDASSETASGATLGYGSTYPDATRGSGSMAS